eukprot:TRINITY_DN1952_c0_g1_i1.p1 TRINITY_DN1952_c0_g1~~TRINITY_DN1952_c0_g1_i1.p1  ORF type:complete len:390 (+),score=63.29 TRINITY_DN1952_c0_g1_i1:529-1698(+)
MALLSASLHSSTCQVSRSPVSLPLSSISDSRRLRCLAFYQLSCSSSFNAGIGTVRLRTDEAAERVRGLIAACSVGDGGGDIGEGNDGNGGGGGGDGEGNGDENEDKKKNFTEAIAALRALGNPSLPSDLAQAVRKGRIPAAVVQRYFELKKSVLMRWLMKFPGFNERLLADDLFLAKLAMECGVGIFTKTAAELEKRRENFMKEIDFVIADVAMAIVADFMLVWLPAPTVPLSGSPSVHAGLFTKLFHGCPDNAFQIALRGTSYSFLQRVGAIVRNGGKLFLVGTSASLAGTAATNLLINIRKLMYEVYTGSEVEVPIVSTSLAYGAYMAISSNLRYQILAGIVEQRILEPLFHERKLLLSALCFAARTGNTFLGSLMWVDYARWTGVQ